MESDEDHADATNTDNGYNNEDKKRERQSYKEIVAQNTSRLSQSSVSYSSNDDSGDELKIPQFDSMDNQFYNTNNEPKETSEVIKSEYSNVAQNLMSKMGYKLGKGLGKFEHGRTEPVEASTQKGKRGLGLEPSVVGEIPKDFKWTPDEAKPESKEEVVCKHAYYYFYNFAPTFCV